MELKNREGFEMISSDELHAIKRFAIAVQKFKTTYFVFNRQLNTVLKLADKVQKQEVTDGVDNK